MTHATTSRSLGVVPVREAGSHFSQAWVRLWLSPTHGIETAAAPVEIYLTADQPMRPQAIDFKGRPPTVAGPFSLVRRRSMMLPWMAVLRWRRRPLWSLAGGG
jgi:hypothetical protein